MIQETPVFPFDPTGGGVDERDDDSHPASNQQIGVNPFNLNHLSIHHPLETSNTNMVSSNGSCISLATWTDEESENCKQQQLTTLDKDEEEEVEAEQRIRDDTGYRSFAHYVVLTWRDAATCMCHLVLYMVLLLIPTVGYASAMLYVAILPYHVDYLGSIRNMASESDRWRYVVAVHWSGSFWCNVFFWMIRDSLLIGNVFPLTFAEHDTLRQYRRLSNVLNVVCIVCTAAASTSRFFLTFPGVLEDDDLAVYSVIASNAFVMFNIINNYW
eukprot:PhF_6_TR13631/c0_g1_i2/m.21845